MAATAEVYPTELAAYGCVTPWGGVEATLAALLEGRSALRLTPVLGQDGGDSVPLALIGGRHDETLPPRWLEPVRQLAGTIAGAGWGSARRPVIVTSSNFGVGSMYAFTRDRDARHLRHGPPFAAVELLQRELGWGGNVIAFSHACVTAHLGLAHAARLLHARVADEVLVLSFDFVSPFVAGGFHSLKILNGAPPAPFAAREIGAIGLGDGAAFAVLRRPGRETPRDAVIVEAHALFNEMHHFTSNAPDGSGFAACLHAIARPIAGQRVWVKGHGTGTLEAGRLEAETVAKLFPGAPLVSWKGSLGHTLGSCGLVELAIAASALRAGRIPGTVGTTAPLLADNVAPVAFAADRFDAAVLTSNAFGGAHAALVLRTAQGASAARDVAGEAPQPVLTRYLHHVRVERPVGSESAAEARERLREKFPRAALRRMTHLGMLLGATLEGIAFTPEDALVYATSFAETRALEDFLSSFPGASPLLFQTSIHPGGVQQVLIGRQQPIARLWPLAGRVRLVEQALLAGLLETAPRTLVLGGEERGTWLLEASMASERAFAFAMELKAEAEGAAGRVTLHPVADYERRVPGEPPTLATFADALADRKALTWEGMEGAWSIDWL
jgi:hypothetical protein